MSTRTMTETTVTGREAKVSRNPKGILVELVLWETDNPDERFSNPREKSLGQYAFVRVQYVNEVTEYVRGEPPETDGNAVFYIGSNFGKHYYRSHDHSDVPEDVLDSLRDRGFTLIADVDGGWKKWDGRPEWSDRYVDYTESHVVDDGR